MAFQKIEVNETSHWMHQKLADYDYDTFHGDGKKSHHQDQEYEKLITKIEKDFYVVGQIDNECAATLKINFYHDIDSNTCGNIRKYDHLPKPERRVDDLEKGKISLGRAVSASYSRV